MVPYWSVPSTNSALLIPLAAQDIELGSRRIYYVECSAKFVAFSHVARATIRPARFVRMRTIVVALTYVITYVITYVRKALLLRHIQYKSKMLFLRVAPPTFPSAI